MDVCFFQHLEGQVNRLETDLATVALVILNLESVDENLMDEESWISEGLLKLELQVKWLLKNQLSKSQSSPTIRIRLPNISVPSSFDTNILK